MKSQEFIVEQALPDGGWAFLVRRCY
jgi:hypothetical protein